MESLGLHEETLDEETIQNRMVGFRRPANSTNWQVRGTAMTTTDKMDVEEMKLHVLDLENYIAYHSIVLVTISTLARKRRQQGKQAAFQKLQKLVRFSQFAVSWYGCMLESTYIQIQRKLVYVHSAPTSNPPIRRRISQLVDDNEAYLLTGHTKPHLELLLLHWRLPSAFRESGHVFTGEEAMIVFLHTIRTATAYIRMTPVFGGDPRKYTFYIRAIIKHMYHHFYHKITGDSMRQWLPQIDDFRQAIWDRLLDGIVEEERADGTIIDYELYIPYDTFRVFGWLDDTDMATSRPRPGHPVVNEEGRAVSTDTQRAYYK